MFISKLDKKGRVKKEITFSNSELDETGKWMLVKKLIKLKRKIEKSI